LLADACRNTVEGVPTQGWHRDPSGAHDDRWFSAGRPTPLVRDHGVVSREDLPPGEQPARRDPIAPAAPAARDKFPAAYYWAYWTVVLPCLVAFAAAGLFVASSLVFRPTSGFELAGSAVAWARVDRAGQVVACLAAPALLIAAARRPRWRRATAAAVWGIVSLQIGSFLLSASQYPGNSCWAQPRWAAVTLSDEGPGHPVVTAPPGAHIVVTVPGWWSGTATDVTAASGGILREECTISLPRGGRRTILTAIKPGTTEIGSDVEPPSPFFMPAWLGEVVVRR